MDDLERDLATQLHRRSEEVAPADDLPARIRAHVDRHQRRRRLLQGAVPTLCLLIGAVTLVAVVGHGGGTRPSSSAAPSAGSIGRVPSTTRPSPAPTYGSSNGAATAGPSTAATQAPAFGVAPTAAGWVPVDYGNVQVSVPPGAMIGFGCPDPSASVTVHLGRQPAGVINCPLEPAGLTTVTLESLSARTSTSGLMAHTVNGIKEFSTVEGNPAMASELVPSLGVEALASGPLASQVLGTLTRSPRAVALAAGRAPRVPRSWHRVTFGGLSVAVPVTWPVQHATVGGTPCALEPVWESQPVIGSDGQPAVILDTGRSSPPQKFCVEQIAPIEQNNSVERPTEGLVINPGSLVPPSGVTSYDRCLTIAGLRVCPAQDPQHYGELVLRVRTSSGKTDAVVIGLAGNGQTARTVLYSLRPA